MAIESRSLLERAELTSALAHTAIEAYYDGAFPPASDLADVPLGDAADIAPASPRPNEAT